MANVRLKRHYSIVAHSPDVAELRYGVWNPVSFTLTDNNSSGHLVRILRRLDGSASAAEIAESEGVPESAVDLVLRELSKLDLIEDHPSHALDYYLDHVVPNLTVQEARSESSPSTVVLLGDRIVSEQIAGILTSTSLRDQYEVVMADDCMRRLLDRATSWRFNSLDFEEDMRPFAPWRGQLVIFGVATVNPLELKAFNRVSLHHRIPWIHAAIDGPYLLIGPTFVPFRSPCYECLETRVLMNMRESASYQRYKMALVEGQVTGTGTPIEVVLGAMLNSLTAFEALNFLLTGTSFTVGKMLSLYLPTMEFRFNELLRLPGCVACAPSPESDDTELYFDPRTLLRDHAEGQGSNGA